MQHLKPAASVCNLPLLLQPVIIHPLFGPSCYIHSMWRILSFKLEILNSSFLYFLFFLHDVICDPFLRPAVQERFCDMCPEKLDQGTVKKCVDDRADPHDHPYIIPGDQAEDNSGQHTDNISHDTGKLERDPALCPFLENEGHTVIRCNAHLSHHVKGYAKPCKDASENQDENPKRQCHVSRDHILNQPTDEIRPVSYTHHVYDRAGANAPADCKKKR